MVPLEAILKTSSSKCVQFTPVMTDSLIVPFPVLHWTPTDDKCVFKRCSGGFYVLFLSNISNEYSQRTSTSKENKDIVSPKKKPERQ